MISSAKSVFIFLIREVYEVIVELIATMDITARATPAMQRVVLALRRNRFRKHMVVRCKRSLPFTFASVIVRICA